VFVIFAPSPAWGQFVSCGYYNTVYFSPGYVISIAKHDNVVGGVLRNHWYEFYTHNVAGGDPLTICINSKSAAANISPNERIYIVAEKPAEVIPTGLDVSADGETYHVFTTSSMDVYGVGFIIRWRVRHHGAVGGWHSPDSTFTTVLSPDTSNELYFYQLPLYYSNCTMYGSSYINGQSSRQDWLDHLNALDDSKINCLRIIYGIETQVRMVVTKDAGDWELDYLNSSWSFVFPTIKAGSRAPGNSSATIYSMSRIERAPWGTCQTPSVEQGTVHFNMLYPSDFPNGQWSEARYRDFTLTFRNCPRMNIKYYVHANGNRWVGGPGQSVVGVQGSVPGASDPVAGNPRGFAVQLQHRSTGQHQHSGDVYIHPNEQANPLSLPGTQSYTRNWQGAGASNSSTGVTHTIPMRARLVRTGSSSQQQIQPGPFNTSVIVAIQYP